MLTFAYCFFSTWCWKNTGILWVHPNLVGNMAVFVARFGCPITTPNLLHFGLKFLFWKLSEDVRTRCCQRIWTTLHNQKPTYAIEQKKRPLRVKPIMDKKKAIRFSRYIYISGILYLQWKIQSGNRLPQDHPAVKSSFCGRWSPNCCEQNFLGKLVHVSTIHNRLYGFGGLAEIPVEQKETLAAGSL